MAGRIVARRVGDLDILKCPAAPVYAVQPIVKVLDTPERPVEEVEGFNRVGIWNYSRRFVSCRARDGHTLGTRRCQN